MAQPKQTEGYYSKVQKQNLNIVLDLEEKFSSTNSLTADRSKASPVKEKKIEMIISESEDSVGKSHVFTTPSQTSEEETPVVESPVFR